MTEIVYHIQLFKAFFLTALLADFSALSQATIKGQVVDARNGISLEYVNIGIKAKEVGASSLKNGTFSIRIPSEYQNDSLTFSMVGYHDYNTPISQLVSKENITIRLVEKITKLDELTISSAKLVEKKYGIKKRGIVHFTDGMFKKDDTFEIGHVIKLANKTSQITSVNLHVNSSRPDSGNFRINFYRFNNDDNRPGERIVEKNIFQRHPIREGWLKFDLKEYNIVLKGAVLISVEFIPEHKESIKQILYEVKLGGSSKSFYRRGSLGQWNAPPHHYCLYVTALVDKDAPEDLEEVESVPAFTLTSDSSREPYSIFVRLPKEYESNVQKKYPVIYHVDGNAYFDPISSSLDRRIKKKKVASDAIVVGIGYENAYVMDSLRDRDYTYPKAIPADSFTVSGGGERFYRFVRTELMPHIEKTYRVDTTNRTLMGHSLGGYFVLYALLKETNCNCGFHNFVAASPSISYYENYLQKQFLNLRTGATEEKKLKLFLTIGEMEIGEDPAESFENLERTLSNHEFIYLRSKVYKNLEHMGTAIPSFEEGMEFILLKR